MAILNSMFKSENPNILLIVTDQHNLRALNCYGGDAQTPNIDRLAQQGVLFEDAYSVCPLCTPARASIVTGHFPHRHGMTCNSDNIQGNVSASLHELVDRPGLISRVMQRAGYSCGITGKWHVGTEGGKLFDQTTEASLPSHVGFEGHDAAGHGNGGWGFSDFREYLERNNLQYNLRREENALYGSSIFEGPDEAHISHYLATYSIEMMKRFAERDQPFFLWHNFWGPHSPCFAPERWVEKYREVAKQPPPNFHDFNPQGAGWLNARVANEPDWARWEKTVPYYLGFASFIDEQIGRMLDHLEETGLAENTLVLLTADHGEYLGAHGGLHNKGWGHYEEIARIPMILRLPGQERREGDTTPPVGPGTRLPQLASGIDIYATVVDAAGAGDDAAQYHPHGLSLLGPARGEEVAWREAVVMEGFGLGHLPTTAFTCRRDHWKYGFNFCGKDELYDLRQDPHETRNLIDDPDLEDIRRQLLEDIVQWMEQTDHHPHGILEFKSARLGEPATH